MKRGLFYVVCAIFCAACIFGSSACEEEGNAMAVTLVPTDINAVGIKDDIDYFVVPEPAASAKVKAISGLNFVGDLQKLYGGENGYPQAVVVAKNDLIGTERLKEFTAALSLSREWLTDESTTAETIADAIQSKLTDGLQPTVTAQNLTKDAIKNCGIRYVPALDCKEEIISFMEGLNSVSATSFGVPSEEFFNGSTVDAYTGEISAYVPDGAPALGAAKLLAENALENVRFEVVNPNVIHTLVSGARPKADICILPVNLAVKLLGDASKYKLVGTLTHGNLYILSKNGAALNAENIERLAGKRVGVVNLAAVPGLTTKLILKKYGINYVEPLGA